MKIVLLAEAQRRFEAEDEWWRENRDAKELFIEEFEQTLDRLLILEIHTVWGAHRGRGPKL